MFRPDTTMFRVVYIGDNGALQGTKGWAWTEARQPGLTFLKWMYSIDDAEDGKVWQVIAPLELEFERNWSKKKDREIQDFPFPSMRYAQNMVTERYGTNYDINTIRRMCNIPEPKETQEVLYLNDLFAQHDSADQIRAERLAHDISYQHQREEAMRQIDSILGADLDQEARDSERIVDLGWDDKEVAESFEAKFQETVKGVLSLPLPIQADEEIEVVDLCLESPIKTKKTSAARTAAASSKSVRELPSVSLELPAPKTHQKKSVVSTTTTVEIVDLFLDTIEEEVIVVDLGL